MNKPIRVFTPSLMFLGEIDNYTSFSISRRFLESGSFEIQIPLTNKFAEYLVKGNIIVLGKEAHKNGVIRYQQISVDEEGTEVVSVIGSTLDGILSRRLTKPPAGEAYESKQDHVESVIHHYINSNVVNPVDEKRKIDIINLLQGNSLGPVIKDKSRYKNLREELTRLQITHNLGLKAAVNYSTKKVDISVYEGVDRTTGNRVIFSPDYDNIQSQAYVSDDTNNKTVAYVAGQGEGAARSIEVVGDKSGLDRIETFFDARDIDNSEELRERGIQKLLETPIIETFEGNVFPNTTFKYEKDWDLGDIVNMQNLKWGVSMDTRITEVIETYEEDGLTLEVTFGNKMPTLVSLIKKELSNMDSEITR